MLKKLVFGVVAVTVALCSLIAMRPDTYTVQRTATLKASPDVAFALVNDFRRWGEWSPWDKLDPNQKRTFEGAELGTGARYGWSGNDQVGEGRMSIEESKANELVRIKLEFLKPWASTNATSFQFSPTADGVSVTWKMEGYSDFLGKAMSLFVDMDAMLGKDFDAGLANMGKAAEAEMQKRAEAAKLAAEKAAPVEGQPAPGETVAAPTP